MLAHATFNIKEPSASAGEINMLESRYLNLQDRNAQYVSAFWFVVLFAGISYVALSTRAILSPFEVKHFIDPKRIISVLVGAWVLSATISSATSAHSRGSRAQIFAVLQISLPGVLGIFLIRELYDLAVLGDLAQRLSLNIRWMLTFTGYFAAAVATFFALSYHRQLQAVGASITPNTVAINPLNDRIERAEIADLLIALHAQVGYETADVDFTTEGAALKDRHAKIDHLIAKFADKKVH